MLVRPRSLPHEAARLPLSGVDRRASRICFPDVWAVLKVVQVRLAPERLDVSGRGETTQRASKSTLHGPRIVQTGDLGSSSLPLGNAFSKVMPSTEQTPSMMKVGILSSLMLEKLGPMASILNEEFEFIKIRPRRPVAVAVDAFAGWGIKDTLSSTRARAQAQEAGIPYLALEDGFLRSLDLGVKNSPPLSVVVDPDGLYYDATRPSSLEKMLQNGGWETRDLLVRSRAGIELLRRERLSKYNAQPEIDPAALGIGAGRAVLVLDQTAKDASITLGLATADSFTAMVRAARQENPDAWILIKTHPDVVAGKKAGFLTPLQETDDRTVLIGEAVNPWSLLDRVDTVYTVTSQMGFEALLAGKRVRCFGMPFYAGWGCTEDELTCPRRTRRRTVEEVFAAAYLLYPRYYDPFDNCRCSFERAAEILATIKRHNEQNRGNSVCLGMSRWKRRTIARFLKSSDGQVFFESSAARALKRARKHQARLVVWGSKPYPGLTEACQQQGTPLLLMEDGFLRSVGLGASFAPASSLVLDAHGMYYDSRNPSDLEVLIAQTEFSPEQLARARRLREEIVRRGITKYNVGKKVTTLSPPPGRRCLFVAGQVEDDASVRFGSPELKSNEALLKQARARNPDAYIVFKPHPDVAAGYRTGAVSPDVAARYADVVTEDVSSAVLIDLADEIHTMTSLVGFEALLREKTVITYGQPFYAGWGLTLDQAPIPRRTRRLTLDQLVAAALLLYPRYVDPLTGLACAPEVILDRLASGSTHYLAAISPAKRLAMRMRRTFGGLCSLFMRK